jgi:hypothetical protein
VHSAPDERRCRVAGYAWAAGIPVVGMNCIGSVLPKVLREPPYFFECADYASFPGAIIAALDSARTGPDFTPARQHVSQEPAALEMIAMLGALAQSRQLALSPHPVNATGFDLRMGRHHGIAFGTNRLEQDLGAFVTILQNRMDAELAILAASPDPENAIVGLDPVPPRAVFEPRPPSLVRRALRKLKKAVA